MKLIPLDSAPSNTPILVIKTLKFEKIKFQNLSVFPVERPGRCAPGYLRLGLARCSTITREPKVVKRNGLQIRDPEKILHIIAASYAKKMFIFFLENVL